MAREKKPVHRVQMTEGKRNIIHQLLEEYDIQTAEDIQDALKDLLGGTIKEMMEAEMDNHLGYEKSQRSDSDDYRNGYKEKQVNSSYGSMKIEVPQDRKSTFEPQIVKKRQKDISDIDQKIISMYAKGMTTRQISDTFEDIYGFETSEGFISDVTDKILPQIEDWQNHPLDDVYPIIYIDAIHYSVRDNGIIRKLAAYVILGINKDGIKEVLSITVGENESSKYWLSVLNELKKRGVKDILIICADYGERFYVNGTTNLNAANLATGSKVFSIMKILLERGEIDKDTLLVLDEPEAHLHPKWQNAFAEIIMILVKEVGCNVLLTTHSSNFMLAIDAYMRKYGMDEKCNFYKTS